MTSVNFDEPSTGNVNSDDKTALAIKNTGKGGGMLCESTNDGVIGKSTGSVGVRGESERTTGVVGVSTAQWGATEPRRQHPSRAAIAGYSTSLGWGYGVAGNIKGVGGAGLWGVADNEAGNGIGVRGESKNGVGVYGVSQRNDGVHGESSTTGVVGISNGKAGTGIFGETVNPEGGAGVWGKSKNWVGVFGESQTNVGIWGRAPIAGRFEGAVEVSGDVRVTGDIKLLNGDCAEDFDIDESELENVEAGTIMVLTENGSLQSSYQEYDKRVIGIVSGASGYKPAIVLDRQEQDKNTKHKNRQPISLIGKAYCKVDARHSSIEIGDLLTTSSTKGYAMKADDHVKAFGAVIGKALGSIKEGLGMIPVLVTLQ